MLPKDSEDRVQLDVEKCKEWLSKGAQPTERVARFLGAAGLWEWKALKKPQKSQLKKHLLKTAQSLKKSRSSAVMNFKTRHMAGFFIRGQISKSWLVLKR